MQPVYTHAQLEALQVPVLELLTLHLAGQPYPLVRLDGRHRPDVAALARAHRTTGALTFTTQWIGALPRVPGAQCWLLVAVERPAVNFTLAFTLPAALADLADVAITRSLTLLFDSCPDQATAPSLVAESRLWPLVAASLTLRLDGAGCHRLAQYLVGWPASPAEGEGQWRAI